MIGRGPVARAAVYSSVFSPPAGVSGAGGNGRPSFFMSSSRYFSPCAAGSFFELPPLKSAFIGLLLAGVFNYFFRRDVKTGLVNFVDAARSGAESSLKIGATVGVIGIIIGVLTFSGLVLTFADIVIELAGGSLVLTILLIALASLV